MTLPFNVFATLKDIEEENNPTNKIIKQNQLEETLNNQDNHKKHFLVEFIKKNKLNINNYEKMD